MFEFFVEFRRKIIDFGILFDAISIGVSIFSWLNFDAKSSIMVCFLMELPSACRFFRARVSTRASYAPLQPLVVTASASALRDHVVLGRIPPLLRLVSEEEPHRYEVTESARACSYYCEYSGSRYCNSSFRLLAGQFWLGKFGWSSVFKGVLSTFWCI